MKDDNNYQPAYFEEYTYEGYALEAELDEMLYSFNIELSHERPAPSNIFFFKAFWTYQNSKNSEGIDNINKIAFAPDAKYRIVPFSHKGSHRINAHIKCCGSWIELTHFGVGCDRCGAEYSKSGELLADRAHWGEETGENIVDMMNGSDD